MTAQVTLVLPLNGRPLHTLRLLFHLNEIGFRYPLLIADGHVSEPVTSILENKKNFPALIYDYIRYPEDSSYTRFYEKMADATARITTPYTMLIDNDDFPIVSGIIESVAFLEQAHDYVCCGAGVAGFSIKPSSTALNDICGAIDRLEYRYSEVYRGCDLSSDSAWTRANMGFERFFITYYSVYRTEALATLHAELRALNFSDLVMHEAYFYLRTYLMGKVRVLSDKISYLRQHGTSTLYTHRKDWATHLLRSSYTSDFRRFQDAIAQHLDVSECSPKTDVREWLLQIYARRLRTDLQNHFYTEHRYIDLAKRVLKPISRLRRGICKLAEPRFSHKLAGLIATLRQNGASVSGADALRAEVNAVEAMLTSSRLAAFLRIKAPFLVQQGSWNK
jgi:glycosyltransferase domain-containing protein